jgi:hypothetical protein
VEEEKKVCAWASSNSNGETATKAILDDVMVNIMN